MDLKNKTILVTGASSGIGRATAILCASAGAKVYLLARNSKRLLDTFSVLDGKGHQTIAVDLTHENELEKVIDNIEKLDGVVHCAGTLTSCLGKNAKDSIYKPLFEANVFSCFLLNGLLLRKKYLKRGASIVFVSSASANHVTEIGNAFYAASKGALTSFAKGMALELAPRKIRVNIVSPGMVITPLIKKFDVSEEDLVLDEQKYPLGYGKPEDVANVITFLLTDAAHWITGTDILIDGGRSLI